MGADKAGLVTDGETQLARAVRLLEGCLERVFVSARADQAGDPVRRDFDHIIDRYDDLGPVAGILSAMEEHPQASWLVLACDLPQADAATISYLRDNVSDEHIATAYVSVVDELPEPLCAVYRPAAKAVIEGFVADGIKCPRKMLINSKTRLLRQPSPGALHNINTPEDLAGTGISIST
jgi:molybdopterin-guanine dinucleotide biosynthesis protein A